MRNPRWRGLPSLFLLPLLLSSANLCAQSESNRARSLPAPRAELVAVPLPDLEAVEPEVGKQLAALQDGLLELTRTAAVSTEKLSEGYGLLGQTYQAYALLVSAQACYLNAHRLAPKEFRWAYFLAILYQQDGQAEEAIRYFQLAGGLRADYPAAFVHLGNLYWQTNRLEEARANFERALTLNDRNAAAHYGLGQIALSTRNYTTAVNQLEQALTLAPDANRLHYALAMAYRGLGKLDEAQAHLQRQGGVGVRVRDPLVDDLQTLLQGERLQMLRGRLAFDVGRFAEAVEAFRKAVAAKPDSLSARVNLGSALAQTGDLAGAIEQFNEALRLNPNNEAALYNLGALRAQQNQPDAAIEPLKRLVSIRPLDSDARFLLAQQLLKVKRADEALAEFLAIVENHPDNEEALLEAVNLLFNRRQYRQALDRLESAHARFPQKGRTTVTLAYVLAACPQYDLRDGGRALQLARPVYQATGSVQHGAIVAMALAELGQCREASAWQRQLVARAEQENRPELAAKLRADLQRYESATPCRPPGDSGNSEKQIR